MKKCSKCGVRKALGEFHRDKRAKDGLYSSCKNCHRAKTKRYYEENREEVRKKQREYQREHPERRRAAVKRWEEKNPDSLPKRKKRYRKRHATKIGEYYADYYERNREKILAQKAEYREENREAIYARRDKEKHAEYVRKRRALKLEAYVAPVRDEEIIKRDQGICGICGKPIMGKLEIDHVVPLTAGGTHEPGNVQLTHLACNRRKHARVNFTLTAD